MPAHTNIIRIIEYGEGHYEKPNKEPRLVTFVVIELAQGGELCQYIMIGNKFDERTARYFFK